MRRGWSRTLAVPAGFALPLAVVLLGGCYRYAPIAVENEVGRGKDLRAHLAHPQDFRLTNVTANGITVVEGEMVGWRGDSLAMSAFWLVSQTGYESQADGETIMIPRAALNGLEEKRLDVLRTGALTAGALALGAITGVAISSGGATRDPINGGGPPNTN